MTKWQSLTRAQREALPQAEQDRLYAEYVESCRGSEHGNTRPTDQGSNYSPRGWGKP